MTGRLIPATLMACLCGGASLAEVPRVAVDVAPVHSLVARVMDGVGTPDLIIPVGASPHGYSLRPSEARALQDADVVFWMGAALSPWLENAIETLAHDAMVTDLPQADGTRLLDIREGALFEAHDHGHEDHARDEDHAHADEDHQPHADEDHAHADEGHAHDEDAHAGHDHGAHDPHAWLSPQNAAVWLTEIAARLSAADPENANTYLGNAAAARAEIDALVSEISGMLAPVRGIRFIVFHDAYQYFEDAFDIPAAGAISISDATDPGPARIADIRDRVREAGIACVLSEPQFNPDLVAVVTEGTEARTAVLDPLGTGLQPGPDLYAHLLRGLARSLADCL